MSILHLEPKSGDSVYFEYYNWITWRGKYILAGSYKKKLHLIASLICIYDHNQV